MTVTAIVCGDSLGPKHIMIVDEDSGEVLHTTKEYDRITEAQGMAKQWFLDNDDLAEMTWKRQWDEAQISASSTKPRNAKPRYPINI